MSSSANSGGFCEERQSPLALPEPQHKHRMETRSAVVQGERDRLRAGRLDAPPISDAQDSRLNDCPAMRAEKPSIRDLSRFCELWLTRHETVVHDLPHGSAIVVDFATGHYVAAVSALDAMDRFDLLFGSGRPAWAHDIGIPIALGSGLWALSSEA